MTNKKLILKADDFHFTNRDDWKNESWTRYFDIFKKINYTLMLVLFLKDSNFGIINFPNQNLSNTMYMD